MSATLLAVLAAGIVFFIFWAPLRASFLALIAVSWLLPSALTLPFSPSSFPSLHRLALAAFLAALVRRARRGEIRWDDARPTRLSLALGAYAIVSFVVGVMLGPQDTKVASAIFSWLPIADSFVFYTAVLIGIRAIDDIAWVAKAVAAVFVGAAGIALGEHATKWSYGRWFFHALPPQTPPPGSFPLEIRGGDVRVRAAADFSLAFAWVSVALVPLVVAVAAHAKRLIAIMFPAALVLSVVWSYSRSAYAGLGAGAFILIVGNRVERRLTSVVVIGALAGLLTIGYQNIVRPTFRTESAAGSTEAREERFPVVLSQPVDHPLRGIGLAGLALHGIDTTDASFLLIYAELGMIGLVAFGLLILLSLRWITPALRAPPGPDRYVGAAVFAGMASLVIGAFAFDGFHVGSARPYWLLAAIGTVIAERVSSPSRVRVAVVVRRALLPAVGVAAGVLLLGSFVPRAAVTFNFATLHISTDVSLASDEGFLGDVFRNTTCEVIRAVADATPGAEASCFDVLPGAPGIGQARLEAPSRAAVEALVLRARTAAVRAVHGFRSFRVDQDYRARPTWVRTAPLWCAGVGLAVGLLLPVVPLRRARASPALAV